MGANPPRGSPRVSSWTSRWGRKDAISASIASGGAEPHLHEAGTVALHGEGHGLAVHPRREGDEHAYHGSQRTSLGDGRSASGRKWPEVCTAKALGRQHCAPIFRELRKAEVQLRRTRERRSSQNSPSTHLGE